MRKLMFALMTLLLVAWAAEAGGPPDRGRGRRGRGDPGRFMAMMGQRREDSNLFRMAERYCQLTDEQREALETLDGQKDAEERAAEAKIRAELDVKYLALILEILPDEEKKKLQQAFDARKERDAAIDAARAEFLEAMTKLAENEAVEPTADPDYIPYGKLDLVRRFISLTEGQRAALDDMRRETWGAMRERMRDIPRPQDWRDANARRQFAEAARKVRNEVDEDTAGKMFELLTDAQKEAYTTAATALETCNQKVEAASEAYEKKLIELGVRDAAPAGGARATEF